MNKIILDFIKDKQHIEPFDWLEGRTYSEAFLICIGAGPWKFARRQKIQSEALKNINKEQDLIEIDINKKIYPLSWQNKFIKNTIKNLNNYKFNEYCSYLKEKKSCYEARQAIKDLAECKQLPKVLSLFCRDSLKIDAFPIDRHVKRKLQQLGLPTKEEEMIRLCYNSGITDIRKVATAFVKEASDMDNPDWSVI